MESKISKIKVKENGANVYLGVLEKGRFKLIPLEEPIWSGGKKYPAAFLIEHSPPAELEVKVHLDEVMGEGKYKLCAYYGNTLVFSSSPQQLQQGQEVIVFYVSAQFKAGEFFTISGKVLSWKLFRNNKPVTGGSIYVDLELYWLYGDDYKLFRKGIPVEILREMSNCFMPEKQINLVHFDTQQCLLKLEGTQKGKLFRDWLIEAVVYSCFFKNPPCYDIWNGSSYFTNNESTFNNITFYLTKYLQSGDCPFEVCNCVDMAAAVQVFLRAVGIFDVLFCCISERFYLQLTYLVGRGLSNNPKYANSKKSGFFNWLISGNRECNPIIDRKNKRRTYFNWHCCCCLGNKNNLDKHRVLDACVSPHNDHKNHSVYIHNTVDPINPENIGYPSISLIQHRNGVSNMAWITKCTTKPKFKLTDDFIRKLKIKDEELKPKDEKLEPKDEFFKKFVVYSWSDPRKWSPLAMDKEDEWELLFEDIIPGTGAAMKSWVLENNGMYIHIELYISSSKKNCPICWFLQIGSNTTLTELPYKKTACRLGQYSAKSVTGSHSKYFWVFHNLVFTVHFHNVKKKVLNSLLKWLNKVSKDKNQIKSSIDGYLPEEDDIKCHKTNPKIGEIVFVEMKPMENFFLDFIFKEGDGLRLVKETEESLSFKALKKSKNTLVVSAVSNDTLLVRSKEIPIEVQ